MNRLFFLLCLTINTTTFTALVRPSARTKRKNQKLIKVVENTISHKNYSKNQATIHMLVRKGANINASLFRVSDSLHKKTLLETTIFWGDLRLLTIAIKAGANVNHRNKYNETALTLVINTLYDEDAPELGIEFIKKLLNAGACICDADFPELLKISQTHAAIRDIVPAM